MAEIDTKIPEARVDKENRQRNLHATSTKRHSHHRRSWMSAIKRATQAVETLQDDLSSPFIFPGEEEKEIYHKEIMHKPIKKSSYKRRDDDIIEPMTPYNPSQYIVKCTSPCGSSPEHIEESVSVETTNYASVLDFMTKDMFEEWGKVDAGKQSPSFHAPEKETLSQLIGYLWQKLDEKNRIIESLRHEASSLSGENA